MSNFKTDLLKSIKQLFKSNYYTFKYYSLLRLYMAGLQKRETLIVYQMGRVGSTTILKSLNSLNLHISIYHVHGLTKNSLNNNEKMYKSNFLKLQSIHQHFLQSLYLSKQLNSKLKNEKVKIVTLVRDPIAKNISSFFLSGIDLVLNYSLENKIKHFSTDEIVNELINLFFTKYDHEAPLTWFDREFQSVFGMDVFSKQFTKTKGYEIYHEDNIDVLLLKLENLNNIAPQAFKEFLGIEDFKLVLSNRANDKAYYAIYKKFLDTIILPNSYIDRVYNSKYMQHFYSAEEIEILKAKWSKLILAPSN